ncbi:MAG: hypothetical protein JNK86_04470 [Alphaproteobacteria bacterium]|nr:hypothetical protein [Alphaproteobacteria bacterium]
MARKFFIKIFILLFPFIALLAYPALVIILADEEISVDRALVLELNAGQATLYGPAFTNEVPYYKLQKTIQNNPDVLILGTSRVMQFRSGFFQQHVKMYNSGGAVSYLWEYKDFLQNIPKQSLPKLIIIGIDQWQFNPNWRSDRFNAYKNNIQPEPFVRIEHSFLNILQTNFWKIYKYTFRGQINFLNLLNKSGERHEVGLTAIMDQQGFRADGSYRYGDRFLDNSDERYNDVRRRIEKNSNLFERSQNTADRKSMLKDFLEFCKQNGIHVIAFLPPYSLDSFEIMNNLYPDYKYLSDIAGVLKPVFSRYNFTFVDFTDPAVLGVTNDSEMIDGFHGSEKTYLRVIIRLAEADERLRQLVDLSYLRQLLDTRPGPLYIFGD